MRTKATCLIVLLFLLRSTAVLGVAIEVMSTPLDNQSTLNQAVVDKIQSYLAVLLTQHGFQVFEHDPGPECQQLDCLAEVAKGFSKDLFSLAAIIPLGGKCKTTVTIYDVSLVAVVAGSQSSRCSEKELVKAFEDVVAQVGRKRSDLAGKMRARLDMTFQPVIWGHKLGYLSLTSSPWGRVWIDGVDTEKTTPLTGYQLPAGQHRVEVRSPAGTMKARVEIWPDEATSLVMRLPANHLSSTGKSGLLLLNTKPWSQVAIDGKHVGMTPISRLLLAGKHQVQITFAHGEVMREEITIRDKQTLKLVREAKTPENYKYNPGMGQLKIHSSPWGRIWVDGKDLGKATPVFSCQLPAGIHEIAIHFSSGGFMTESVNITAGKTTRKIIREQ